MKLTSEIMIVLYDFFQSLHSNRNRKKTSSIINGVDFVSLKLKTSNVHMAEYRFGRYQVESF